MKNQGAPRPQIGKTGSQGAAGQLLVITLGVAAGILLACYLIVIYVGNKANELDEFARAEQMREQEARRSQEMAEARSEGQRLSRERPYREIQEAQAAAAQRERAAEMDAFRADQERKAAEAALEAQRIASEQEAQRLADRAKQARLALVAGERAVLDSASKEAAAWLTAGLRGDARKRHEQFLAAASIYLAAPITMPTVAAEISEADEAQAIELAMARVAATATDPSRIKFVSARVARRSSPSEKDHYVLVWGALKSWKSSTEPIDGDWCVLLVNEAVSKPDGDRVAASARVSPSWISHVQVFNVRAGNR